MKSTSPFLAACLLCTAMGCSKQEPDDPDLLTGPYASLSDAFAELSPDEQIYTLNATTGGTITGINGTQLIFGPQTLMNAAGDLIDGNVTVRLIEILSVEDMITSGIFPVDVDGNLLNSGGEIYVNITQGGQTLAIASGETYTIRIPSNGTDTPMDWYLGTGDPDEGFWSYVVPTLDSLGGEPWDDPYYDAFTDMYEIITNTLGWMNCDALAEYGTVLCLLQVTGVAEVDMDALSFFYLPDLLMCAEAIGGTWDEPTNTLSSNIYDSPGYILVTTIYLGNFYFGLSHIDPEEGAMYDIPIAESTMTEFEAALDALW